VEIDVKPLAVGVTGHSTDRVICGTTGALEPRRCEGVAHRLAAK